MPQAFWRPWWLLPLTGLLLWAAWPMSPLTPLLFVAFVPLLWTDAHTASGSRFFWIALLNMLIWNVGTTWWIWNSTGPGAVGAMVANSLLMCAPLMLMRYTRRMAGTGWGLAAFVLYWLAFEYLHHRWELSWPWLTLGNAFATQPGWVQWYSLTGTTGGSLWVLGVNALLYAGLVRARAGSLRPAHYAWLMLALGLPFGASRFLERSYASLNTLPARSPHVVVVQPNVEPYTEKFSTPPEQLVQSLLQLTEQATTPETRLVAWPETAIPAQAWEHQLPDNPVYQPIRQWLQRHPQVMLVTGIDSYKLWGTQSPGGLSIRRLDDQYYEAFNTALAADSSWRLQLYHKSRLVPGVESLPSWLGFMSSVFDKFGGTSGTLGRSDSAVVFATPPNPYRPAPIICYESIYADYVASYVRRGANVLCIVTNDGWWGNTPGHHQHMAMARLRAIENRRWVVRSANTGISCFISPTGQVLQPQPWNTQAAIVQAVAPLDELTWFSQHGDWLSRIALPLAALLLAWVAGKRLWGRLKR